jgi:transcriptional regulator with XRE-family HTH domain
MHIGNRIREILKEKGMNQSQLAEKMSVSRQMISSLVNSESVTTDTLEKIIKALDVSITYFFPGNQTEKLQVDEKNKELESKIKRYKHAILSLRSYINNGAIEGRGVTSVKFQEDILNWNIVWGKLQEPISQDQYKAVAKEIGEDIDKLFTNEEGADK